MSVYALLDEDGQVLLYPYTYEAFRRAHPNLSLSSKKFHTDTEGMKSEYNIVPVRRIENPYHDPVTSYIRVDSKPTYQNGEWVLLPRVINKTQDRIQAESEQASLEAKGQRNMLLSETDWTQVEDVPDSIKIPFKEYRNKLRAITEQKGFPHEINWPQRPE